MFLWSCCAVQFRGSVTCPGFVGGDATAWQVHRTGCYQEGEQADNCAGNKGQRCEVLHNVLRELGRACQEKGRELLLAPFKFLVL